jgi:hypothetical protein
VVSGAKRVTWRIPEQIGTDGVIVRNRSNQRRVVIKKVPGGGVPPG